jgi:hypothetical protein
MRLLSTVDVCGWPHRPDGTTQRVVAAGAGGVTSGGGEYGDAEGSGNVGAVVGADEMSLFVSTLRGGRGQSAGKDGSKVKDGEAKGKREKKPPPTRQEMTDILLG